MLSVTDVTMGKTAPLGAEKEKQDTLAHSRGHSPTPGSRIQSSSGPRAVACAGPSPLPTVFASSRCGRQERHARFSEDTPRSHCQAPGLPSPPEHARLLSQDIPDKGLRTPCGRPRFPREKESLSSPAHARGPTSKATRTASGGAGNVGRAGASAKCRVRGADSAHV